jgi:adenine-specific DNA-methyltransferase
MLKQNGELIFITPEYWLTTTYAKKLRNHIMNNGHLEFIVNFGETPIFPKVNISLIVFKFVKKKGSLTKIINYDDTCTPTKEQYTKLEHQLNRSNNRSLIMPANNTWSTKITINENSGTSSLFSKTDKTLIDVCDIANGMVSGLDKAFRVEIAKDKFNETEIKSIIKVAKAKNLNRFFAKDYSNYVFVNNYTDELSFTKENPNLAAKLSSFKKDLLRRYSYNENTYYWNWSFPRNQSYFESPRKRIFVPGKERITNKDYVRFALVDDNTYATQDALSIFPKKGTQESILYILAYLNSRQVFNWLKNNAVVRGGILELSKFPLSRIPFYSINFDNANEFLIYEEILETTKRIIHNQTSELSKLQILFDKLARTLD